MGHSAEVYLHAVFSRGIARWDANFTLVKWVVDVYTYDVRYRDYFTFS